MQSVRRLLGRDKPVVRVIPLVGSIMARSGGGRNLNFAGVQKQVEDAFDCKKVQPKAVVLNINSPGGSAVQSNLIYSRIRNLADKTKVPVISFIEDTCASGGYWLALAGDEIYADPNSVVGSIGALSMVFGVEETLKKLGNRKFTNAVSYRLHVCHVPKISLYAKSASRPITMGQ